MTHKPVTIFDDYIAICVERKTLTDGSFVYDVNFGSVTINATSKDDAIMMANAIADAISEHSTIEAQAMINKNVA